ncbi:MAG: S8 family serine peptidase [Burkholderiales bacterium]|nr:S8 family serine peptidase [Burkholderiales bacterium]
MPLASIMLEIRSCFAGAAVCALLAGCGGGSDVDGTTSAVDVHAPVAAVTPRSGAEPIATPSAEPDEVIVKLFRTEDLAAILGDYGLTLLDRFGSRPIYRLLAASGTDTEDLAEELASDPRVQYAQENLIAETPEGRRRHVWAIGGNAGVYAAQWATRALRLGEAHAVSTGRGVTVAVLDSGVDAAHPALAGRLVAGFDFVDFDDDPSEVGMLGDAGFGHGTHVASLVAQVAPDARIMPIRVLDRHGMGNVWVLAEALLHAVDPDGVPATDDGAKVISLSLGTLHKTELLEDVIDLVDCEDDADVDVDDAQDEDDAVRCAVGGAAVVVSAAGNSGDETLHYPAAEELDAALAVAASTEAGTLAQYSTRGPWVQLAAPGDRIVGAVPGGQWAVWSGTSMATPMVAGAAALLRAAHPTWQPSEVTHRLIADAAPLCDTALRQVDPARTLTGTSAPRATCG